MERVTHERDREQPRAAEPLPAADTSPGSLAWASALGNQAVARLARQAAPEVAEEEPVAAEELVAPEEAPAEDEAPAPEAPPGMEGIEELEELPE